MKPSSNRKSIPLKRPTEAKRSILGNFEADLHQNIQSYLSLEREKLRNLDKATAKKIISTAERSLMNFMRSKAKVNCFRQKNAQLQPYATLQPRSNSLPQNIFDQKKLQIALEKQQRKMKPINNNSSPLMEQSLRQVRELAQKGEKGGGTSRVSLVAKENNSTELYCSYSSKKKSNRMIYY